MLKRVVGTLATVTVALVVLLAVEGFIALNGPGLPDRPALRLDRTFQVGGESNEPIRLAWLGDSTGAGIGASGAEAAVVTLVASELGRPVELRVLARSGARVGDVLAQQLPRLADVDADAVVVAVGGNDVTHLTSEDLFEAQYDLLLDTLARLPSSTIVSVGIGDFGTVPRIPQPLRALVAWRGRALDELIRKVTSRHDVAYVDLYGETGPVFAVDPGRYYAPDEFHPNDLGYRVWADAILEVLRPAIAG
ncbi:MAG TPA: SGNH/GDSL hydrolase family protein [Actinomycetota bacterium]|nr:SGNH/GDSL hydrolase family protein [Actinomycetota bacterium]